MDIGVSFIEVVLKGYVPSNLLGVVRNAMKRAEVVKSKSAKEEPMPVKEVVSKGLVSTKMLFQCFLE